MAKEFIRLEETDFERAKDLRALGFTDMDALHIASAEKGDIDFLITCDDRIVKFYKKETHTIKVTIMNLLEFVNM